MKFQHSYVIANYCGSISYLFSLRARGALPHTSPYTNTLSVYSLFENKRTIFTHKILAQITESTRTHLPCGAG
jgi:hypothetical protein